MTVKSSLTWPMRGEALPGVLNRTTDAGYRIRAVDLEEPNLEAVFLHPDRPGITRLITVPIMNKIARITWKDLLVTFRDRAALILMIGDRCCSQSAWDWLPGLSRMTAIRYCR
ncbi:MAG: hypothetical protein R3C44_19315 [Chloroflexota bacterium]